MWNPNHMFLATLSHHSEEKTELKHPDLTACYLQAVFNNIMGIACNSLQRQSMWRGNEGQSTGKMQCDGGD